ncbi:DUF1488 domain-containing protein [Pusillimonas sp. MFBS29]|uniref:DUF1488 family protein n=1 Tax=Pusillimonas sp. MFBS29 TaxID=2886690 RepID=UPI001D12D83A|nr:DUF1488 family protein [Pusillimonas sp. MFBS29]MCC2595435.1 DUF1488 domain-containing protein [Pusillimonas sp. MFBS29]
MTKFAKATEAKYHEGYIRFNWKHEGEDRSFEISDEALIQAFGARDATATELLEAFERGREQISLAVEQSLNTPTDGVTELGSGDFAQDNARHQGDSYEKM